MAGSYTLTSDSYCKVLLHAAKYPHRTINGLLIGEEESHGRYLVTDAVPLFHNAVGLTAPMEIAFAQVEAYCKQYNKRVVGYYQANELLNFNGLTVFSAGIGQKILENCSNACVLIVRNDNLIPDKEDGPTSAFRLFVPTDNRGWKEASEQKLSAEEGSLEKFVAAVEKNLETDLIDFDNYLDNPANDWLNQKLFDSKSRKAS